MATGRPKHVSLAQRLLHQVWPYWPYIAGVFLVDLCATPLALLAPVPLKIAVDTVIGAQPLPGFMAALLPTSVTQAPVLLLAVAAGLQVMVVLLSQLQGLSSYVLQTLTGERLILEFPGSFIPSRATSGVYVSRCPWHGGYDLSYPI